MARRRQVCRRVRRGWRRCAIASAQVGEAKGLIVREEGRSWYGRIVECAPLVMLEGTGAIHHWQQVVSALVLQSP